MLAGLDEEVDGFAVGAVQSEAAVGGGVAAHDAHIGANALQEHDRLRRDLRAPQILPRHLHIRERLLLHPQTEATQQTTIPTADELLSML